MITGSRACACTCRTITITAELGYQAHTGSVGPTARTTEPCPPARPSSSRTAPLRPTRCPSPPRTGSPGREAIGLASSPIAAHEDQWAAGIQRTSPVTPARRRLEDPHRQRSPRHGQPARHRPRTRRLAQPCRRSRSLPVASRPRTRPDQACTARKLAPWASRMRRALRIPTSGVRTIPRVMPQTASAASRLNHETTMAEKWGACEAPLPLAAEFGGGIVAVAPICRKRFKERGAVNP